MGCMAGITFMYQLEGKVSPSQHNAADSTYISKLKQIVKKEK